MRCYQGGFHCGAVKVTFESAADPAGLEVRACACGFCTRHSARTATDPAGKLAIDAAEGAARAYRFAMGITDFIVCGHCGCYIGAQMEDGGERVRIVNSRMLEDRPAFTRLPRCVTMVPKMKTAAAPEDARRGRR